MIVALSMISYVLIGVLFVCVFNALKLPSFPGEKDAGKWDDLAKGMGILLWWVLLLSWAAVLIARPLIFITDKLIGEKN